MTPFDTSIRDRAIKERRERLEKERVRLLGVVEKTLRENREKYNIREAYITGSLLQPHRWYQLSDVDVVVGGCSQHVFSIMMELEEVTEKDVNVIDLDNHPSPDWVRGRSVSVYEAASKPVPISFEAELSASHTMIEHTYGRILERQSAFKDDSESVASMAYQLHNLYGAYEQLFKIVAGFFEDRMVDARHHTDLLRRMKTEIKGMRPALISSVTHKMLNELRGFRHFFRHAYRAKLDADRVERLVQIAIQLKEPFRQDMDNFLEQLK